MWRGLEVILKGRDPRDAWAFTQRICGVCTGTHALTSVRAVEDALGIQIPENANIIRNIMHLTLYVQDHLVHFYHLHALDWVDVVSRAVGRPEGDQRAGAVDLAAGPSRSPGYFRDLQTTAEEVRRESGQLGPFRNGYWGHPAYKLPPEANLMAVAHYLEALDFQKEIVKIHTVFGGKNPHPNWLVGGVPCAINSDDVGAVGAINIERLNLVQRDYRRQPTTSSSRSTSPTCSPSPRSTRTGRIGGGLSAILLSYGDLPDSRPTTTPPSSLLMPRGAILNGNLNEVHAVDLDRSRSRSRSSSPTPGTATRREQGGLHPWDGVTEPNFDLGRTPRARRPISSPSTRAPSTPGSRRRAGGATPMEVGPLARYIIGYASGIPGVQGAGRQSAQELSLPVTALFSTLGRTAARGLECALGRAQAAGTSMTS